MLTPEQITKSAILRHVKKLNADQIRERELSEIYLVGIIRLLGNEPVELKYLSDLCDQISKLNGMSAIDIERLHIQQAQAILSKRYKEILSKQNGKKI